MNKMIENTSDYVIFNKKSGTLVQGNDTEDSSILDEVSADLKGEKLHLLTRIDRPVSGVVLLSKTQKFNNHYLAEQEKGRIIKTYIAIVEGKLEKDKINAVHFHRQDSKFKKARIIDKATKGYKKVELDITCIQELDNYSVLRIELKRGKFHQIRAQLGYMGHSIKGDVKYGARRKNPDRSIYLHAYKIAFTDLDQKERCFEAPLDQEDSLWNLVGDKE